MSRRWFTRAAIAGSAAVLGLGCGGGSSVAETTSPEDGSATPEESSGDEAELTAETEVTAETDVTAEAEAQVDAETDIEVQAEANTAESDGDPSEADSHEPGDETSEEAAEATPVLPTPQEQDWRRSRPPCIQRRERGPNGRMRTVSICPPYGAPPAERFV